MYFRVLSVRLSRGGRWFARAVLRYVAVCVAPLYLLILVISAFAPGGRDADGFARASAEGDFELLRTISVTITIPAILSLVLLSLPAAWGKDVRAAGASLLALPPVLFLFAGVWPFLLLSALGIFYALKVMPKPGS